MPAPDELTRLIDAVTDLKRYFEKVRDDIEADRKNLSAKVDEYIANAAAYSPVTPNLLEDTKHFSKMCGGKVNEAVDMITAHSAPWNCFLHKGTTGHGTVKVVTIDKIAAEGIPYGGDLTRAVHPPGGERPFYGTDFKILLFDVTITSNMNDGNAGMFYAINQGCPTFTGWNKGEFRTQASLFFNLIEQSGEISFHPHANMPVSVRISKDDVGKGWIYRQAAQNGFGGCHQPHFIGKGRMKVAIALPYIGYGDHKGRFVWAGSVGRYSHNDVV
jgi:hypothetical protein